MMASAREVFVGPPLVAIWPSLKSRATRSRANLLIDRMLMMESFVVSEGSETKICHRSLGRRDMLPPPPKDRCGPTTLSAVVMRLRLQEVCKAPVYFRGIYIECWHASMLVFLNHSCRRQSRFQGLENA